LYLINEISILIENFKKDVIIVYSTASHFTEPLQESTQASNQETRSLNCSGKSSTAIQLVTPSTVLRRTSRSFWETPI